MSTKDSYTTTVVVAMIILVIIILVCFSLMTKIEGRVEEPTKPQSEQVIEAIDQNPVVREIYLPNTNKFMYRISKVEFEGHTYIVLEDNGAAILHDPDCQCQTQK